MYISEIIPGTKRDRLAFGLDWRGYATKAAKVERRRYARQLYSAYFTEYVEGEETVGGFCTLPTRYGFRTRIYSAAVWLSALPQIRAVDAALVVVVNEGRAFVIFIARGSVRSDEVTTVEAAASKRIDIQDQCDRNRWTLKVFGNVRSMDGIDEYLDLSEFTVNRKIGLLRSVPLTVPRFVIYGGVAIAFLVVVRQVTQMLAPPPAPPHHAPTYQDQYAIAVKKAFGGRPIVASTLTSDLLAQLGQFDTNKAGWQFRKAICNGLGECKIEWVREGGTFSDFDGAAPAAWRPIDFGADGTSLVTVGPVAKKFAFRPVDKNQLWPTWNQFKKSLQQPAQRLSSDPERLVSFGYHVTLHEPTDLLGRPPTPPLPKFHPLKVGKWEIDGYKWQSHLIDLLPQNMILDKLVVDLSKDGAHFHAEGTFYVVT